MIVLVSFGFLAALPGFSGSLESGRRERQTTSGVWNHRLMEWNGTCEGSSHIGGSLRKRPFIRQIGTGAASNRLQATSYKLQGTGNRLRVKLRLQATSCRLQASGYRLQAQVTMDRLQETGYKRQAEGYNNICREPSCSCQGYIFHSR